MPFSRANRALLAAGLLLSLPACALLPKRAHWAKVEPVQTRSAVDPADGAYQAAKAAIGRRDYAAALDLLQAARMRKADDARVLNAFGVVYDKLGRFDLSARYYAQAAELDPSSSVVAHNLAYSRSMQATAARPAVPSAAPPLVMAKAEQAGLRLLQVGPNVLRLELPTQVAAAVPLPKTTGFPLMVIDATGKKDGGEAVRLELAQRGWSARRSAKEPAPAAQTTIRYSESQANLAKALSRTLPHGAQMVLCSTACPGVQLVLGMDSLNWRLSRPAAPVARPG